MTALAFRYDLDQQHAQLRWEIKRGERGGITRVLAPCDQCGQVLSLAPRTAREIRQHHRRPLCPSCRKPARIEPTAELVGWWLERHTIAELGELAEGLRGFLDHWPARQLPAFEAVLLPRHGQPVLLRVPETASERLAA